MPEYRNREKGEVRQMLGAVRLRLLCEADACKTIVSVTMAGPLALPCNVQQHHTRGVYHRHGGTGDWWHFTENDRD